MPGIFTRPGAPASILMTCSSPEHSHDSSQMNNTFDELKKLFLDHEFKYFIDFVTHLRSEARKQMFPSFRSKIVNANMSFVIGLIWVLVTLSALEAADTEETLSGPEKLIAIHKKLTGQDANIDQVETLLAEANQIIENLSLDERYDEIIEREHLIHLYRLSQEDRSNVDCHMLNLETRAFIYKDFKRWPVLKEYVHKLNSDMYAECVKQFEADMKSSFDSIKTPEMVNKLNQLSEKVLDALSSSGGTSASLLTDSYDKTSVAKGLHTFLLENHVDLDKPANIRMDSHLHNLDQFSNDIIVDHCHTFRSHLGIYIEKYHRLIETAIRADITLNWNRESIKNLQWNHLCDALIWHLNDFYLISHYDYEDLHTIVYAEESEELLEPDAMANQIDILNTILYTRHSFLGEDHSAELDNLNQLDDLNDVSRLQCYPNRFRIMTLLEQENENYVNIKRYIRHQANDQLLECLEPFETELYRRSMILSQTHRDNIDELLNKVEHPMRIGSSSVVPIVTRSDIEIPRETFVNGFRVFLLDHGIPARHDMTIQSSLQPMLREQGIPLIVEPCTTLLNLIEELHELYREMVKFDRAEESYFSNATRKSMSRANICTLLKG